MLRRVRATRYVAPLREGGSLPGLMEADDLGTYVVKFRGAGQGLAALIAEVISAELGRALGLPVPELVIADVDTALASNEPDQEIQELLRRSPGANLGVDFLPGSLDLDAQAFPVDPAFAGRVLWFDALIGNVDRSWRNPNMLYWHGAPYLIDHGASLTFAHDWANAATVRAYDPGEHALIGSHPDLDAADAQYAPLITRDALRAAIALVPDEWLAADPAFDSAEQAREAYLAAMLARLGARDEWLAALRDRAATGGAPRVAQPRGANRPAWLDGPA